MPWAEWALVATCVLWAAAQRTAASGCHYGTLPGCWIRTASRQTVADQGKELVERFPVWQPYSLGCQLKPLLLDYLTVLSLSLSTFFLTPKRPTVYTCSLTVRIVTGRRPVRGCK